MNGDVFWVLKTMFGLALVCATACTGELGGSHVDHGPPGAIDVGGADRGAREGNADAASMADALGADTATDGDLRDAQPDVNLVDQGRRDGAPEPVVPDASHGFDATADAALLPDAAAQSDAAVLPDLSVSPDQGVQLDDWLAADGWTHVAFPAVGGQVVIEYDMRALDAPVDAVAGLGLGPAARYQDLAMISRMSEAGQLDVRDGGDYAADVAIPYQANTVYHVRIDADCAAHRYEVRVSAPGADPILMRQAGFRLESVVDTVDHLSFYEDESRLEVGNLRVDGRRVPMAAVEPPQPMGGLWAIDFQDSPLGNYTSDRVEADWAGTEWANPRDRVSVEAEGDNRFIRVRYPRGGVGPGEGGAQWKVQFEAFRGRTYDELYVSYRLRFRAGFDFIRGGKLPGLLGGAGNTGGDRPTGRDGWSGRMMWRRLGAAVQYLYHPDQPGQYGDDLEWEQAFPTNQWVTVEHRIVMNTPGERDGIVQGWYGGVLSLDRQDIRFRDIPDFAIDGFYFSTFFGGSGDEWAPVRDEFIDFDDFVFSDRPITH